MESFLSYSPNELAILLTDISCKVYITSPFNFKVRKKMYSNILNYCEDQVILKNIKINNLKINSMHIKYNDSEIYFKIEEKKIGNNYESGTIKFEYVKFYYKFSNFRIQNKYLNKSKIIIRLVYMVDIKDDKFKDVYSNKYLIDVYYNHFNVSIIDVILENMSDAVINYMFSFPNYNPMKEICDISKLKELFKNVPDIIKKNDLFSEIKQIIRNNKSAKIEKISTDIINNIIGLP